MQIAMQQQNSWRTYPYQFLSRDQRTDSILSCSIRSADLDLTSVLLAPIHLSSYKQQAFAAV